MASHPLRSLSADYWSDWQAAFPGHNNGQLMSFVRAAIIALVLLATLVLIVWW